MNGDPTDFSYFENALQQRQQKRSNLNLRFYSETVENKARSLAAGHACYDMVDYVSINVAGSKDEVVEKMGAAQIARFGPQYEAWKKTQEQPVDGTPITTVPFLNIAQIKEFQACNVMTLEQLANLSDTGVQKVGMGAHDARKKAQAYMKAAGDSAFSQRLTDENLKLKADLAQQQQQIAQLSQRIEALMSGGSGPSLHPSVVLGAPQPQPLDIAELVREEIRKALSK